MYKEKKNDEKPNLTVFNCNNLKHKQWAIVDRRRTNLSNIIFKIRLIKPLFFSLLLYFFVRFGY